MNPSYTTRVMNEWSLKARVLASIPSLAPEVLPYWMGMLHLATEQIIWYGLFIITDYKKRDLRQPVRESTAKNKDENVSQNVRAYEAFF